MSRTLKTIIACLTLLFGFGFIVFMINQTEQVVSLASHISPHFGTVVLWFLLAIYAILVGVPVILYLRLPRPITPPKTMEGSAFEAHLRTLRRRLSANRYVKEMPLSDAADIEAALKVLNAKAEGVIKEASSAVFLSTAISQSGSLDSLLVLSTQSHMIWRISHIYYQRPTFRDMLHLYANVAATAFLTSEIEDIDISEIAGNMVEGALGGAVGSIPGIQQVTGLFAGSVLSGSANAFLTLRVGMIAKRYCGSLVVEKKGVMRRLASAEAAKLLMTIGGDLTRKLAPALVGAARTKLTGTLTGAASGFAKGGKSLWRMILREQPGTE